MASWFDLVGYVKDNYKVAEERPTMLKMFFQTGGGRSQVVYIWRSSLAGGQEEWIQIESPIAAVSEINLAALLKHVGETVVGGLAQVEDLVTLRHSVPLENLDVNEFERPLELITNTADRLEAQFIGADRF